MREFAPLNISSMRTLTVRYTNHRGETAVRRIQPYLVRYGTSQWHPEPGWLMYAIDLDRNVERGFAMKDMEVIDDG